MFTVSADSILFRCPDLSRTLTFAIELATFFEGATITISGGPTIL